jgi:hypothetical protein
MRWIIVASLLWGRWCHKCLLREVGVDLSDIVQLEVCRWGSDLLLSSDSSGGVGVFTLLTLRACFTVLRWYIYRDDQDLAI